MEKAENFDILNGTLLQYTGNAAEVVIPEGVESV